MSDQLTEDRKKIIIDKSVFLDQKGKHMIINHLKGLNLSKVIKSISTGVEIDLDSEVFTEQVIHGLYILVDSYFEKMNTLNTTP
jgi:hypothetical protein